MVKNSHIRKRVLRNEAALKLPVLVFLQFVVCHIIYGRLGAFFPDLSFDINTITFYEIQGMLIDEHPGLSALLHIIVRYPLGFLMNFLVIFIVPHEIYLNQSFSLRLLLIKFLRSTRNTWNSLINNFYIQYFNYFMNLYFCKIIFMLIVTLVFILYFYMFHLYVNIIF